MEGLLAISGSTLPYEVSCYSGSDGHLLSKFNI